MGSQDVVAEVTDMMKKVPDLDRLLSKIHALGSVSRSKNHPDSRAIFFEAVAYRWRFYFAALFGINQIIKYIVCYYKYSEIPLTFSVLLAIYVAMSCPIPVCYRLGLTLCAIGDISRHSFINFNFAGLLSTTTRISTQLSMTSHGEKEAVNAAVFNLFTGHFVEFERCFCY